MYTGFSGVDWCEAQNKNGIFSGLFFGMSLVTLCRVLILMFVDFKNRIIVVFALSQEWKQEVREVVTGWSGSRFVSRTYIEWNVYELSVIELRLSCPVNAKKDLKCSNLFVESAKCEMWCNIPRTYDNLFTQNRCRCARHKPLMKLPQKSILKIYATLRVTVINTVLKAFRKTGDAVNKIFSSTFHKMSFPVLRRTFSLLEIRQLHNLDINTNSHPTLELRLKKNSDRLCKKFHSSSRKERDKADLK